MINYNNFQNFFVEDNGEQEKQMLMEAMKSFVKQRFLVARSHEFLMKIAFILRLGMFSGYFLIFL